MLWWHYTAQSIFLRGSEFARCLSSFPGMAHHPVTQTSKVQGDCTGLAIISYQPRQQLAEASQAYWARTLNSPDKSVVHCVDLQDTSVSSTERTVRSWMREHHQLELFIRLHLGKNDSCDEIPVSSALQQESRDFL